MSQRDKLFEQPGYNPADFVFDERVVEVFPDMISRSVPGYHLIIPLIGLLARQHAQPGSAIYDLGCSLGAATHAMRQAIDVSPVRFVAVDNSPAMIAELRRRMADDPVLAPVEAVEADIATTPIVDASVTVLNFTLQFIPADRRLDLLRRIAAGTRPGGILLLSEKIAFGDAHEQALLTDSYHDFKRAQGYSDLEISRKRNALERVLVPDTEAVHFARLQEAGWSRPMRWFQALNFAAYIAFR
jgi:tRNA (cmo5U34)-methyltransferase